MTEVIKSGHWVGYPYPGPKTAELARSFANLQDGGYAAPMTNGTVTMEVALRAAGIGWGDKVIVPAYTFQATASAPMPLAEKHDLIVIEDCVHAHGAKWNGRGEDRSQGIFG